MCRSGALLVAFLLAFCVTAHAEWECIGPSGGPIGYVAGSKVDPQVVFATSGYNPFSLIKSTDCASSWITMGTCATNAYCLETSASDVLFVGSQYSVYRSTNEGVSWTMHSVPNVYVYSLAAHPTDASRIYGTGYSTTGSMVFIQSANGGTSWSSSTVGAGYGRCLSVSQSSPQNMFIGGYVFTDGDAVSPILLRTTNGGSSWTDVTPSGASDDSYIFAVDIHPTNPDIVLTGSYQHIFRSANGGLSWSTVATQQYNYDLEFSEVDPDVVYGSGYNTMSVSTDCGLTWYADSLGLSGKGYTNVVAGGTAASMAYTGNAVGLFKTIDTGQSWFLSCEGIEVAEIYALCPAPTQQSTIYTTAGGLGLFCSDDDGENWDMLTMPLGCGVVCALAVDTSSPDLVLALEGTG